MRLIFPPFPPDAKPSPGFLRVLLTSDEMKIIGDAVNLVRETIDDAEFSTRLGIDATTADALMATFASSRARENATVQSSRIVQISELNDFLVFLTDDEVLLINNALNEVVFGLPPTETPALHHVPEEEIETLRAAASSILDEVVPRAPSRGG